MPFVQRVVEPKNLGRTSLWDADGKPRVAADELQAVTNGTLSNALRQLASIVVIANDIFDELKGQLDVVVRRSEKLREKIRLVDGRLAECDPKKVTVPEGNICEFALRKVHFAADQRHDTGLFTANTRPQALRQLYEAASRTPVHVMRQLDRWRRDGHRSSRFFLCTPVLGEKRRRIRNKVDIDIETRMPAAIEELRRWTSAEALGELTVTPDCANRILQTNATTTDGDTTDGTLVSDDDEGVDHKLPSPEEQLQVVALKFPAEIVAVDVSGRHFDRMSMQRRSMLHGAVDEEAQRRRTKTRRPRNRRRNTIAGTDQKEIHEALTAGEEPCPSSTNPPTEPPRTVCRSKSSEIAARKDASVERKSHFSTLKQWGRTRMERLMSRNGETRRDADEMNVYEAVASRRRRSVEKERRPSASSTEQVSVKLRECASQRRQRRDEPHSSSGNWSASSESGRASIGSEPTTTTPQPKSTTSTATSSNSLNQPAPSSIGSRRRFPASASGSVTSEGTLTPDIIHDLHEDGETSSVYSCDTEGYYTSFHMDSGLKTLKEEDLPSTPMHSTSAFSNNTVLTAENEYELFGKGSTSTTTSSAGTVCTTLRASESNRSLTACPAVPERKSSLSKLSTKTKMHESAMECDGDKTGTVKRSPANSKANVAKNGDVSPDSGHNTSSSPIESINSPNGARSGSEFEFSESSDMEGPERIERIRLKTTINSSRIPSMCVITPPHSDDEGSCKSYKISDPGQTELTNNNVVQKVTTTNHNGVNKTQAINANPQSGYASVETVTNAKTVRDPSPNGGNAEIKVTPVCIKPPPQPILKASLMPLNSMFGRLKTNLVNLTNRREAKSPNRNETKLEDVLLDGGEYVTLSDVRNNNDEKAKTQIYANDVVNNKPKTEYVCLNELPLEEVSTQDQSDGKKRQGARVTLDAEGKVIYSSDSLKRHQKAHTTFEPGPFVKREEPKSLVTTRPAASPQLVIRAVAGASEIVRVPTVVAGGARAASPKTRGGAYVHVRDAHDKERVPSPSDYQMAFGNQSTYQTEMFVRHPIDHRYLDNQYYHQSGSIYQTLPIRKTQYFQTDVNPERSVTPDITRGLHRNDAVSCMTGRMQVPSEKRVDPYTDNNESLKISPIDPRLAGSFKASTPATKNQESRNTLDYKLLSPKKSTMSNEELYAVIHKSKKKMNISSDVERMPSPVEEKRKGTNSPESGYLGEKSRSRLSWSPSKGEYVDFNSDIDKLSPPNESRNRQSWACSDRKGPAQTSRLDFKKLLLQKSNVIIGNPKKLSAVEQLKLSKQQMQTNVKPPQSNSMAILELSGSPRSLVNRKFANNPQRAPVEKVQKPVPKLLSPRAQWRFASPRSDVLSSTILEDCREDESPNNSIEKKRRGTAKALDFDGCSPIRPESPKDIRNSAQVSEPRLSAMQRLHAQRAQFFAGTASDQTPKLKNQQNDNKTALLPTLETAF